MTYHCANCREEFDEKGVKKTAIGSNRNLVFCASCNCYIQLEDKNPKKTPQAPQTPQK